MEQLRSLLGMIRRPFEEIDLESPLPKFLTTPISLGGKTSASSASARPRRTSTRRNRSAGSKNRTVQFSLEGTLEQGYKTLFSINGHDITTNSDTWIFGELIVGNHAKVKGIIVHDHERVCTSIIATPL
jgi:hypothetical protein